MEDITNQSSTLPFRLTGDVCSGVGGRAGMEKGKPFVVVGLHGIYRLGYQHKSSNKCPMLITGQRPTPGPMNYNGVGEGGRIYQKVVATTQTREKETPTRRKHVVCSIEQLLSSSKDTTLGSEGSTKPCGR